MRRSLSGAPGYGVTRLRPTRFGTSNQYRVTLVWHGLLNLRQVLVNSFLFKLCDGSEVKFFIDHWMKGNRVPEILDQQTQHLLCPPETRCSAFIRNGAWVLPRTATAVVQQLWRRVSKVQNCQDIQAYTLIWIGNGGNSYSVAAGYKTLRTKFCAVSWHNLLWHSMHVPRWSISVWRRLHRKLATQDTLKRRGFRLASRCEICKGSEETMDHLFFECKLQSGYGRLFF